MGPNASCRRRARGGNPPGGRAPSTSATCQPAQSSHLLGVVHALALERSDRTWAERVLPCAVAPFLAPRDWSLRERPRSVELPGPEPTEGGSA